MEFRLLGPVEIVDDSGRRIELAANRVQALYAGELAGSIDRADECQQALRRLLDHYLRTADAGDQWLRPYRDPDVLPDACATTYVQNFGGYQEAFEWFEAEYPNLVALIEHAARQGFDGHATHLARTITGFLERRGLWSTWVTVMQTAVECSSRAGDSPGQVMAHRYRAHALTRTGQLDEALSLNYVGWLHASAFGEYEQAIEYCHQAQELYQGVDHKLGEAATWDHLGYAYRGLQDLSESIACSRTSVTSRQS